MAVTLPVSLLLIDYYYDRSDYYSILREKIPYFIYSAFIILMTLGATQEMRVDSVEITHFDRVVIAFSGIGFYLEKTLFPINLAIIYHYGMIDPAMRNYIIFSASASILLLLFLFLLANKNSRLLLCFYLVTLSPVLGFFQIGPQEVADRFSYLPIMPFFLGIAWLILAFLTNQKSNIGQNVRITLVTILSVLLFSLFFTLSFQQTKIWNNSLTLWTYQFRVRPDPKALFKLGDYFLRKNDYQRALIYYQEGIRLFPDDPDFYILSAITHFKLKNYSESYKLSIKTLQMNPLSVDALKIMWALEPDTNKQSELKQKIDRISSLTAAPSLLQ